MIINLLRADKMTVSDNQAIYDMAEDLVRTDYHSDTFRFRHYAVILDAGIKVGYGEQF